MRVLQQRLAALPADRRDRFLALLDADAPPRPSAPRSIPRLGAETSPLTPVQRTRLAAIEVERDTAVLGVWLRGRPDVGALEQALAQLVAGHEALRVAFDSSEALLYRIEPTLPVPLRTGPPVSAAEAPAVSAAAAAEPIELDGPALWRAHLIVVDEHDAVLVLVVSRLVADDDALALLLEELGALYRAATGVQELPRAGGGPELLDVMQWEAGRAAGPLNTQWLRSYQAVELPLDRPRPSEPDPAVRGLSIPVDEAVSAGVAATAARLQVEPASMYLTALIALLQRYCRQDDLVVGVANRRRDHPDLARVVGRLADVLPVRVEAGGGPSWRELVARVQTSLGQVRAHAGHALSEITTTLPADDRPAELLRVGFAARKALVAPSFGPTVTAAVAEIAPATSLHELSLEVREDGADTRIALLYRSAVLDQATAEAFGRHYLRLLSQLVAAVESPVEQAELIGPDERAELLGRWNGVRRSSPPATLHAWFADQATRTPAATAVVAGAESISYGQLSDRVARLAEVLRGRGAGPGRIVAVCLPRGIQHVTAVLAVLASGAAFLPLDPAHPPSRLRDLLVDAAPVAVLTTDELADVAATPGRPALVAPADGVDSLPSAPAAPGPSSGPDDPAYVLYTSGSTGRPKAVVVSHRAAVNFIEAMRDLFTLTPDDRFLGYAANTFDVSIFETFGALLCGGQLHLALDGERLDIDRLQALLQDGRITVTDLPPAVMAMLRPEPLADLRIVFVGGEAFPAELVNRWNPGRRLFNGYGPTECTVTMIVHECPGRWETSPPIGLPIANHVAHVLDRQGRPVPYGVPGELVIGGLGLAQGYLDAPELTAERFVPDPFGTSPGGRLYHTGDLVRRRRDGALVFLGRIDRQLKVRGLRIEPAEIEAALAAYPGVRQSIATVWKDHGGEPHLVAYIGQQPGSGLTPAQLRRHAAAVLPSTLVPDHIIVLDELPLTSSGKIDQRALPTPDQARSAAAEPAPVTQPAPQWTPVAEPAPVTQPAPQWTPTAESAPLAEPAPLVEPAPLTQPAPTAEPAPTAAAVPMAAPAPDPSPAGLGATARALADELFGPALGLDTVPATATFFELGGSSVQAAQLLFGIRRRFAVEISVADFFREPTIAGLAVTIDRARAAELDGAGLLGLVESMTSDEVDRWLRADTERTV